jgi:hypothetical protein
MARLDEILQKLQNQPPWNVPRFRETAPGLGLFTPEPWYQVSGEIVYAVALRDADLETQIEELSAQIQFWGRMEGICERAVEWHERALRVWKGSRIKALKSPPEGEDLKGWKKPTDKEVEGAYRNEDEYQRLYSRIEEAREALTSTKWVREAFQVKSKMVDKYVRRSIDDGRPRVQA